jgi:sodium/hydrogen antiporter
MPSDLIHVDISESSKSLAVLGGFIVIYGLVSFVVKERLYLSEPLLAVILGIVVGPYALNWIDPLTWSDEETVHELTYQFTRVVVGIQVLFTGVSLPKAYLWKERLSLTVLLFGIMTTAWFTTALLIWAIVPGLTYLESLCIASAVTPTDPVLANSITTGRYAEEHVPANVRNIIIAESGANDGLGFPFLFLSIYLLARSGEDKGASVGLEIGQWIYAVVIYQIILSIGYGALVGYIARKTLRWAEGRSYIDKANFFAYGLGLAFFTLGTTGLFGSDDILACFIAGNSFTWDDWFRIRTEDNDFQEILDTVLNMAIFVYIGTIIPWADYKSVELGLTAWRAAVLSITVLLLRRPPWLIASTKIIPALRDWKESSFAGWFGPIGVSAVFYIEVALKEIPEDGTRDKLRAYYNPLVLLLVFASVLAHGITIPVSKLGPGVMKRTVTLTRTLTFSRQATQVQDTNQANGKPPSSTGVQLANRWLSKTFSFRNKEKASLSTAIISEPRNPVRQEEGVPPRLEEIVEEDREVEAGMDAEQLASNSEDKARNTRLPPPILELPTSRTSSPSVVVEQPSSPGEPSQDQRDGGVGSFFMRALGRQLSAEREEARAEAQRGWRRGQEREERRIRQLQIQRLASNEGTSQGPSEPARIHGDQKRSK